MDVYCSCRLTLEIGMAHGALITSTDVKIVAFEELGISMFFEILFITYVCLLTLGELKEFFLYFRSPEQLMSERLIERRYELRYELLRSAAFQGVAPYNPHSVLAKLSTRLFSKYGDFENDDITKRVSQEHIVALNQIGKKIALLHNTLISLHDSGFQVGRTLDEFLRVTPDTQAQAGLAVILIFDKVKLIHEQTANFLELKRSKGFKDCLSPSGLLQQLRLRMPVAFTGYFRDPWNCK